MKYLDTNVIVYAIENHPRYGEACKRILEDVEDGKLRVSCSVLILVELISVLKKLNGVLSRQGGKELVIEDNIGAVLSLPITWVDLDLLIIEKASTYSFNISGVDYTHVATMEVSSITEILSADGEFDRVPMIKRIDPLGFGRS